MASPNQAKVSQNNGEVDITSDGTKDKFGSYTWNDGPRSILGCEVSIGLNRAPDAGTSVAAFFQFAKPGAMTHVGFLELSGTIHFVVRDNGMLVDDTAIPYDETAHRYLRLREAGGTVFYETSKDQSTWTVQHQTATPAWASAGVLSFGAGAVAATSGTTVIFDQLQ